MPEALRNNVEVAGPNPRTRGKLTYQKKSKTGQYFLSPIIFSFDVCRIKTYCINSTMLLRHNQEEIHNQEEMHLFTSIVEIPIDNI